jgi:hypothetical protein
MLNSGWNYKSSSSFITMSFWFRCSTNQTFLAQVFNHDSTRGYDFSFTASGNDTWTKITKTIPGNSNLVFNDDNGIGLRIHITPFYGTDFTNNLTLDQWSTITSSNQFPDMASTWLTAGASTFDITGVQLEVGSVATDFEHRSYGQELALCQRYFNRYNTETVNGHFFLAAGYNSSNAGARGSFPFTVPMRAIPSLALSDLSHFAELGSSKTMSSITLADSGTGKNLTGLTVTFSSNTTAGFAHVIRAASTSAYLQFDAEL